MARPIRVVCVVGTRPNFMKVAPLYEAFGTDSSFAPTLVHTGQHYDAGMSAVFLQELGLPQPDHYLDVGSGTHAEQTGTAMVRFESLLLSDPPDLVVVVGDVNSSLACALAASKLCVPIAHIEAGLRSFDRTMPEEVNRVLIDAISDLLFVTEAAGIEHLKREGCSPERVFLVGDTMIDALIALLPKARLRAPELHKRFDLQERAYGVVTIHRPANVDDAATLQSLLETFRAISERTPLVLPMHPRTRERVEEFDLGKLLSVPGLRVVEPLGYLDFLSLVDSSHFLLTDSGGVPEECTYLGVNCLTLRSTTERPFTIEHGTNQLVGNDPRKILLAVESVLAAANERLPPPADWDGKASQRVVERVLKWFASKRDGAGTPSPGTP